MTLAGATPLHRTLAADPAEVSASIENAALGLTDAIWIERVVLATRMTEAPARPATDGLADVVALLDDVTADPHAVKERLAEALRPLTAKLPAAALTDLDDHDDLIAEARDLLLGRLTADGGVP